MLIGGAQNHAPAQIRHRAVLAVAATVAEDPALTSLCLPGHDGPAAIAPAERDTYHRDRDAEGEYVPWIALPQ